MNLEEGGPSDSFTGDAVDAVESPGDVGDEGEMVIMVRWSWVKTLVPEWYQ